MRLRASRFAGARRATGALFAGFAGLSALAAVSACSATHDPAAGILLSVDTNLRVPDDIDSIGVAVGVANDGGTDEDNVFPLAPNGSTKFPATLAILRGTDKPIQIRAVGYKDGQAIALHDTVTTLPADRVALLSVELNWLDKPLVAGTAADAVSSLTTSCPAGETPLAGTCTSFTLDSDTLTTYATTAVAPSDGPSAVDIDSCFAGAQTVTPDAATCSFTPPAGVTDAQQINVALVPAPGHTAGWCNGSSCVVPLPADSPEGWSLGSDGLIHLPPAACSNPSVQAVVVSPTSAGCPAISPAHPAGQDYGTAADGGEDASTDAGLDATMSMRDGGGAEGGGGDSGAGEEGGTPDGSMEASSPEAGPVAAVYLRHSGVVSIAADATHLFVLSDSGHSVEVFSLDFASTDIVTPVLYDTLTTAAGAYPASTATNPYFVVTDSSGALQAVNVSVPGTVDEVDSNGIDPALANPGDGPIELAWAEAINAYDETFTNGSTPGGNEQSLQTDAYHVAYDPTSAARSPSFVSSGETDENSNFVAYGPLGDHGIIAESLNAIPTQFAFPLATGHFAWSDDTGAISLWTGTGVAGVEPTGTVNTAERSLAGASGHLVWITPNGGLDSVSVSATGTAGTIAPVRAFADGGTPTGVHQVIAQGSTIVWFDGNGIYRLDAAALP